MNRFAFLSVIVVLIVVVSFYAGWTYPRTTVTLPVSLIAGLDSQKTVFEQSVLEDKVQVQITVESNDMLWSAQILNGSQIVWEHSTAQVEQQNYISDWISLPSGNYTFTIENAGFGSLDATATVTSKGGFW